MRILRGIAIISIVLSVGAGCTTMVVEKAVPGSNPNGVRIPGKALLMFVGVSSSSFACVDVDEGAYDVRPVAVLAKMNLRIENNECGVAVFDAQQDTTLSISLFEKALSPILGGGTGGKTVSAPAAASENFGYAPGVYRLGRDLQWQIIKRPENSPRP